MHFTKQLQTASILLAVLMHFNISAQKSIFDNYIIAGANFTINNFNKGTTTYDVVNSPYKNEIVNGKQVAFGFNTFILKKKKLNIKLGFLLNYLSENEHVFVEKEQRFSNRDYDVLGITRTETHKTIDFPVTFEYKLFSKNKKLYLFSSIVPKISRISVNEIPYNYTFGNLNITKQNISNNKFSLNLNLGVSYYMPLKYFLLQPFVKYRKSFSRYWDMDFEVSNIQNRPYTKLKGNRYQSGSGFSLGFNIYPAKITKFKKAYKADRNKFKKEYKKYQKNFFDYYANTGIHSSLDMHIPFQQEITYNVADSPIAYSMYVAPGYSLGFNRVVYSNKSKIVKIGLQYSTIPFSDHTKWDETQGNVDREEWDVLYDEGFVTFSIPISFECVLKNKRTNKPFIFAEFQPTYWKHGISSFSFGSFPIITGTTINTNNRNFRYNQKIGFGYYLPTKYVLFQPYLYYSQSFTNLWDGDFFVDGIINKPYTTVTGTFKDKGNSFGFGLNIYFKKPKRRLERIAEKRKENIVE